MESTGVVRRIDDLGRIVIPKEIRRTLGIKDGSSLEIFVDKDVIALRRHSTMNNLKEATDMYSDVIYNTLKITTMITDRDSVISYAGPNKKKFADKKISKFLDECLINRANKLEKNITEVEIVANDKIKCSYLINTIVANGDAIGLIILIKDKEITDKEEVTAQIAASFLGKHIEE